MQAEAAEIVRQSPELQRRLALTESSFWGNFKPRPDSPELFDQQESFCLNKDQVAFLVGGNASGTTECSAWKTARFLLYDQPPPRPNTPFWVISNTYDQVCGVCWGEKLYGNGHIPDEEIDWPKARWYRPKLNWPYSIPLKPWPGTNNNWVIEFKSYIQGRTALQARSIGGFWFSEQFPWQLFVETIRGCRDCMFPGGQFAEFTPIDPDLCMAIEGIMDNPPKGWKFYRCNTDCNLPNLEGGQAWYDSFFGAVPDEMMETRKTGALATFEGVIYPSFNPAIHVVKGDTVFPPGIFHYRGIDWGASEEHPWVCLWGYRDGIGDWVIYDEYWSVDQSRITCDHLVEVVEKSRDWGWPGRWKEDSTMGPVWLPTPNIHFRETYADPSRPGEINEFSMRGVVTLGAATDVYKGIDAVRTLLKVQPATNKPRIMIHERCVHTIEEHRKYRWLKGKKPSETVVTRNPKVATPVPLKRDDDCCDSARYMIFSESISRGLSPGSMSHRDYVKQRHSVRFQGNGTQHGMQLERGAER